MARKAAANVDPGVKPPEPAPEITQPVEVTIEPETEETDTGAATATDGVEAPVQSGTPAPSEGAPVSDRGDKRAGQELAPASPPEEKETPREIALRQRLAEMENADRLNKQAIEEANRKVREANQQRSEAARREFDAQMDSINNSIGAAQSIIESATPELEAAANAQDWKAFAEVQSKLAKTTAQLERFEYQKGLMEQRLEQSKRQQPTQQRQQPQPQPQQPQRPASLEESIAAMPVPDRAKNWLRQHSEYLTDQTKNKLIQSAHDIAVLKAGAEFNDGYFEHLENLLGIQRPVKNGSAGPPVSAPPTREAPSMATGTAPKKIRGTLTPEEREIAQQIAQSRDIPQAEAERIYLKELIKLKPERGKG